MAGVAKVMAGVAGVMAGLKARSAGTAVLNLCQHHVCLQPARQNHSVHLLTQLASNCMSQAYAGRVQVFWQGAAGYRNRRVGMLILF